MKSLAPRVIAAVMAILLILIVLANPFFKPWHDGPGEGKASMIAYRDLGPVIQALERYRAAHGAYPDSLAALTPQFIKSLPQADGANGDLSYAYASSAGGADFRLSFHYHGPGTNSCDFSAAKAWDCSGAF
jgi:hypothetical protein